MTTQSRWLVVLALITCALPLSHAEVSVSGPGHASFLLASGGDDPYPFPTWTIVRINAPQDVFLNYYGDMNGDGAPAFAMNPVTSQPEVVWSWNDGHDHEIVLSRWDGQQWTVAQVLTSADEEDLDPALWIDESGTRHITWWRHGTPDQVWYMRLSPGQVPLAQETVTQPVETGLHPDAIAPGGEARVGYQQAGPAGTRVIVARRDAGIWQQTIVAETTYSGPAGDGVIDVKVHARAGKVWADWVSGAGTLGYSVYDAATSTWGAVQTRAYTWTAPGDTERLARERARVDVRLAVLPN